MASLTSTPLLGSSTPASLSPLQSFSSSTPSSATPVATPTSKPTPAKEEGYVEKFQKVLRLDKSAKQSLLWSGVNATLFSVVLYDLTESCSQRPNWAEYTELAFLVVLFINIVYHLANYFYILVTFKPVPLTADQKKLLGVSENDPKFPTLTEEMIAKSKAQAASDKISPPQTPINFSAASWFNSTLLSQKSTASPNVSGLLNTPNLSAMQQANISLNQTWASASPSWNNSLNSSLSTSWMCRTNSGTPTTTTPVNVESDEPVVDEASLLRYLDKLEKMEQKMVTNTSQSPLNSSPTNLSILWNSQVNSTSPDLILPTNMTYHLSTNIQAPTLNKTGSPGIESLPGVTSISTNEKFWQKEGVSQERLSQWNKNLRQWITMTVLNPVIKEIDDVNQALQRLGNEERVGSSSLDKIKPVSNSLQVQQYIPNFPTLLTFLEVTQNQQYLVQRIRELASGGCMSDFRWNSGGNFNGKPWDDTLPTDTQIIMHFLAMYLDVQLPPMRHRPDPRPFSAVHMSKAVDKPKCGDNIILIHEATANPPHYVLIWKNSVYEVPKGRNNLLHTVLLFLHKLKAEDAGMLGRISMGPSGLNIMWVLA
ncbi:transmembrane protein 209 [Neocloeon triangulifer]|uniref:transmembrane protein 209 n=1 Tax=Neocloeon triangulifer TaxID=2078957 RepID=UPI00286F918E|nr:transmembrane protein 209 [Neocloeon triangulifer]XP_059486157.1 transmembrane protein 209 [Neocloeon triangulifer]